MDIRILKYFLEIAKEQNITHAARNLHIAQPPLSRQLSNLEEELGTPLFIRSGKRMILTEEGRILKERAEQIIGLVDRTATEISYSAFGAGGTVYIGCTETVSSAMLPDWIEIFQKKYPNITYNVWSGNSHDVIERLEEGLIDFAIVREPYNPENLEGVRISCEPWCALISLDSPLANTFGHSIQLEDLRNQNLIVPAIKSRKDEFYRWFDEINCPVNIICEYAPIINAVYLVEKNVGIAILPFSVNNVIAHRNVILKRIVPEIDSHVVILTRKNKLLSHSASRFLEHIYSHFPDDAMKAH